MSLTFFRNIVFGLDGTAMTDGSLLQSFNSTVHFVLPLVSELRKRFESITTSASDWEMNRWVDDTCIKNVGVFFVCFFDDGNIMKDDTKPEVDYCMFIVCV